MGTHVTKYCDRCKKEMPRINGFLVHKYVFRWNLFGKFENCEYELCRDCTDALYSFMRNQENERKNCNDCHNCGSSVVS